MVKGAFPESQLPVAQWNASRSTLEATPPSISVVQSDGDTLRWEWALSSELNQGSERDTYPHYTYRTNGIRDGPPCSRYLDFPLAALSTTFTTKLTRTGRKHGRPLAIAPLGVTDRQEMWFMLHLCYSSMGIPVSATEVVPGGVLHEYSSTDTSWCYVDCWFLRLWCFRAVDQSFHQLC